MLKRHCCEAREVVAADAAAPLTQPGQEEALRTADAATETFEPEEDPELIFLADAANGFNSMSYKGMLWAVCHRWPRLARFAFNCYCHEIRLVVRVPKQIAMIFMSREGVAQGNPLAMAL